MRRDFALGFLAGLIIGLLWQRYTPRGGDNITRLPTEWRRPA